MKRKKSHRVLNLGVKLGLLACVVGCGMGGAGGHASPDHFAVSPEETTLDRKEDSNPPANQLPTPDEIVPRQAEAHSFQSGSSLSGDRIALAPQVGIQPANEGVPAGKIRPSWIIIRVVGLDGTLDSSVYDPQHPPPCQSGGLEIPPLFSDPEKPFVFWKTGTQTQVPLGVQTDGCGRLVINYSAPLPSDYQATEPFPCHPDENFLEIWATFKKTDPENPSKQISYQSPKIKLECPQPGFTQQNIVLQEMQPAILRVLPRNAYLLPAEVLSSE